MVVCDSSFESAEAYGPGPQLPVGQICELYVTSKFFVAHLLQSTPAARFAATAEDELSFNQNCPRPARPEQAMSRQGDIGKRAGHVSHVQHNNLEPCSERWQCRAVSPWPNLW
jgi:hypothetical protein